MTPKQILDSFSETLMQDERILSIQERVLITNLLHHAKAACDRDPDKNAAVRKVIEAAVGETVAQRAFTILGSSIVDRVLAPLAAAAEQPTIYAMPGPGPHPPSPQPPGPGVKRPLPTPPVPPAPHSPGHKHPHKEPLKDIPSSPQPPGTHGALPSRVAVCNDEATDQSATSPIELPKMLHAEFVALDEFLSPLEMKELTLYTLQHEADFETSEVITPTEGGVIDFEHRRSRVLKELAQHEPIIVERVKSVLPGVLAKLGMEEFPVSSVEAQITASNDGDFFRIHPDDGQEEVAARRLTFVYFFHREPRPFEGGELRIHDAILSGGRYVSTGEVKTIVPQQNQIVFFRCSLLHEISPVHCISRAFADSRFTLNGWLRQ